MTTTTTATTTAMLYNVINDQLSLSTQNLLKLHLTDICFEVFEKSQLCALLIFGIVRVTC